MRTAKLFVSGRWQEVRLPKAFRFEGEEVTVKRMGVGVLLLPVESPWQIMRSALDDFEPNFKMERAPQGDQVRGELF
ncbi:antitoxin [Psychrobacter lutiphocae]|uniref:antitoxin n=1 Tax=Psychrobacter lutiphocae TaxID=540500 RepID=UPI00036FA25F|nr:hypothetical protein [Psychrobacter lutiphocae]